MEGSTNRPHIHTPTLRHPLFPAWGCPHMQVVCCLHRAGLEVLLGVEFCTTSETQDAAQVCSHAARMGWAHLPFQSDGCALRRDAWLQSLPGFFDKALGMGRARQGQRAWRHRQ
eukprot:283485-Chlamydomonas_euryale.AAC.1